MKNNGAIVVVAYNRPLCLKRLLKSLCNADYSNDKVDLIISCDYSGKEDVYNVAKQVEWMFGEKKIVCHKEKLGLKKHVLSCLTFAEVYPFIVVLEDDLIVSDSFYSFSKEASIFYDKIDGVAGISLYSYQKNWLKWPLRFEPQKNDCDVFFLQVGQSWGEVFTTSQWLAFKKWLSKNETFIFDDSNPDQLNTWPESSWLRYLIRYCILTNKFFVYPYHGFSSNFSDLGEHNSGIPVNDYQVDLVSNQKSFRFPKFDLDDFHCIKYDAYLNRIGFHSFFNLNANDLCVDFWGTKNINKCNAKYILTTSKIKNIQPIETFALSLRPIENNVLYNLKGKGIYFYNTAKVKKPKIQSSYKQLLLYSFRTNDFIAVNKLRKTLRVYNIRRFFKKISRLFKK